MELIKLLATIVPEVDETFQLRMIILEALVVNDRRVGRKLLSRQIGMSERSLRTNLQTMREQGLVSINRAGICLTEKGDLLYEQLKFLKDDRARLAEIEIALKEALGISACWVMPGDAETDPEVFKKIAQALETILDKELPNPAILTVTGGSTLAHISRHFTETLTWNRQVSVVPSRGGTEGTIHIQSNTVAGMMAQEMAGQYIPLHIPDYVSEDLSRVLLDEPTIQKAINLSKTADCLLLSVGEAEVMAQRRNLQQDQQNLINKFEAVGEAFGVFYDKEGKVVFSIPRLGLQLEDVTAFPLLLVVVTGCRKAQATQAFFKMIDHKGWLICDESLAKQVLNGVTQLKKIP
ncbi:hypothetical protein HZY91_07365 [Facklamia sp. DSM 111018]|uniref:Sugar-binding domain-containing protein n=1 Tax=Facklamia lactis TaxID=2749967 RepID=A0ABS0LRC4_9LACT|nr:sugar-binding domain-containing protein [Facklamia lactis]MBG9980924.1 hypothetical protein [Facklamia lactis]MBG9986713.1 hypothetical protein [Facklamia lactis]